MLVTSVSAFMPLGLCSIMIGSIEVQAALPLYSDASGKLRFDHSSEVTVTTVRHAEGAEIDQLFLVVDELVEKHCWSTVANAALLSLLHGADFQEALGQPTLRPIVRWNAIKWANGNMEIVPDGTVSTLSSLGTPELLGPINAPSIERACQVFDRWPERRNRLGRSGSRSQKKG